MQVACPSCSAEYPVNERRLPATGLKMRCPKCGSRFHVHPDGRTDPADAPAAIAPAKSFGKPADPLGDLDLDLPAPKAPLGSIGQGSPPRGTPREKPAQPDVDLPAPKGVLGSAPVDDFELDLPAPKTPSVRPPAAKPPPALKKPLAPPAAAASRRAA